MTRQSYKKPGAELRIPTKLISKALSQRQVKALWLLSCAKLHGHRCEVKPLIKALKIHPRTGIRLIKKIVSFGWAGFDGKFLFPRAWTKLHLKRRRGLYLTTVFNLRKFECLLFAKCLKREIGWASRHFINGKVKQDFPARFLAEALGLRLRLFETLKARAQRYWFISVTPQVSILGKAKEFSSIRKNLHGIPVFTRGKYTVAPSVSKISVLI